MTARREIEIRVHIPHGKGKATDVLALLTDHHLQPLTCRCCADRDGMILLFTTNRLEEIQHVLDKAVYRYDRHPVVLLGPTANHPGATARLVAELGKQGINIRYSYLSTIDFDKCFMVLETTDNERTLAVVSATN